MFNLTPHSEPSSFPKAPEVIGDQGCLLPKCHELTVVVQVFYVQGR